MELFSFQLFYQRSLLGSTISVIDIWITSLWCGNIFTNIDIWENIYIDIKAIQFTLTLLCTRGFFISFIFLSPNKPTRWKVRERCVLCLPEIFITPGHRILKPFKLVIIYIIMYTLTQFPWHHSPGEIPGNCIYVSIDEFVPAGQFLDRFKSPPGPQTSNTQSTSRVGAQNLCWKGSPTDRFMLSSDLESCPTKVCCVQLKSSICDQTLSTALSWCAESKQRVHPAPSLSLIEETLKKLCETQTHRLSTLFNIIPW